MLDRNFVKTIEKSLKDNWDLPCFSNYGRDTHSYGEIAESMIIFHEAFSKAGLKKGDRIAVCGKNSVNWVKFYLATVTYGAVIVPILPDFSGEDITNIINHSEAKVFFADENIWKRLDINNLKSLEIGGNLEDLHIFMTRISISDKIIAEAQETITSRYNGKPCSNDLNFDEIPNSDMAGIFYTSGTTGFSKGVVLSHNVFIANVDYAQKSIALARGDKIVSFLPLAHCFGGAFDFLFPFSVGAHITFLPKISPQLIIKSMSEIKPRLILSVPLLIEKIYFKQLKPILNKGYAKLPIIKQILEKVIAKKLNNLFGNNFITLVIGAAAFNPEVEAFLTKIKFRFTVGYGMTECGPLISYMPWDVYKSGSAGRLIFHLEAKLINKDPETEQGELCVRGENIMDGYYKNEEATKEVLDEDGYLHTGDMVTMDNGKVITIKGRCKNMLLAAGGQNIYPEEIEAKINNYDIVEDSLVIDRDGKVTAIIHPDYDYTKSIALTDDGIKEELAKTIATVNRALPLYSKVINFEVKTDEFEKTPTSKIKRYKYK